VIRRNHLALSAALALTLPGAALAQDAPAAAPAVAGPPNAATRPLNAPRPALLARPALPPRPVVAGSNTAMQAAIQNAVAAALAAERSHTAAGTTAPVAVPAVNAPEATPPAPAAPAVSTPLNLRGEGTAAAPVNAPTSGTPWAIPLVLLAGLAGLGVFVAKRRPDLLNALRTQAGIPSPGWNGSLTVLRRTGLGMRNELVVVELNGQVMLLGVTPGSIQSLAVLPEEELAQEEAAPTREENNGLGERFAAILDAARAQPRKTERAEKRPAEDLGVEEQARGLLGLRASEG